MPQRVPKSPLKSVETPTINAQKMQNQAAKSTFLNLIKMLNMTNQYARRHDYVYRHTNQRTESTKEVTDAEALAIIKELEDTFKVNDQCDVMRKKIISMAHQMFWQLPNDKIDMERLNGWCVTKGPYKKALNKHDLKELGILVGVFTKVYTQYMNKI